MAALTPVEGRRKVLILDEFHLLRPEAAARLLKTIEEPRRDGLRDPGRRRPARPGDHRLALRPGRLPRRSPTRIAEALEREGVGPTTALASARAAGGNLDRARLLADDPAVAARHRRLPPAAPPPRRHRRTPSPGRRRAARPDRRRGRAAQGAPGRRGWPSSQRADRAVRRAGLGPKRLEERHKRELRRHRTDELKAGLAAAGRDLPRPARRRAPAHHPDAAVVGAVQDIHERHRGARPQRERAPAAPSAPPAPPRPLTAPSFHQQPCASRCGSRREVHTSATAGPEPPVGRRRSAATVPGRSPR